LENGTVPPKPFVHPLFGGQRFYRIKLKISVVILLYFMPEHNICYKDINGDVVYFSLVRNDIIASDIWVQTSIHCVIFVVLHEKV
jgi:hypothetical protein